MPETKCTCLYQAPKFRLPYARSHLDPNSIIMMDMHKNHSEM